MGPKVRNKNRALYFFAATGIALAIAALCILKNFTGSRLLADIVVKDYGTITVALEHNAAPHTVENFVALAQSGFYDGLTFYRIVDGYMIQGGEPGRAGAGGSNQHIIGEFEKNGVNNDLSHIRGAVSMARASEYDSASSQFFIVQRDSPYLDGSYAVFGYVIEGMNVVDQICAGANPLDNNGTIAPEEQPVIISVMIRNQESLFR